MKGREPRSCDCPADIKETKLYALKPKQRVDLRVDAYPGLRFKGYVERIGTAATAKRLPSGEASRQALESPLGALAAYSLPDFQRNAQVYDAGIAASWEVDLFGQLRQGEMAAQADHAVAEAMQAGVRGALSADTADAYFQLRAS